MLTLDQLTFQTANRTILHQLSLTVADGELLAIIGPSGSGKSTLLKLIAGLEQPTSGEIQLDGQSLSAVPAHARNFGFMFQDYALFPHLNVAENIAFGLKMRGASPAVRRERVEALLQLVNLPGFERRQVATLSGGEQQRVALARTLAPEPKLIMLDEPLGALDPALRDRLLPELKTILQQVGVTSLYVTHDQTEAFQLADRIVLLRDGRIAQIDTPQMLYRHPQTRFAAEFLGFRNIFPISLAREALALEKFIPAPQTAALLIPDHAIEITTKSPLRGRVQSCSFRGDVVSLTVRMGADLELHLSIPSSCEPLPQVGDEIPLAIDLNKIIDLRD